MENAYTVFSSYASGLPGPATFLSEPLDVKALGGDGGTLHIYWTDVSITFYLWAATSLLAVPTSPPWHDWTAEYRLIDPAWVDPALGDPTSEYPVRWKNLGFRYVRIGWSASNWGGAAPDMDIFFERDRTF